MRESAPVMMGGVCRSSTSAMHAPCAINASTAIPAAAAAAAGEEFVLGRICAGNIINAAVPTMMAPLSRNGGYWLVALVPMRTDELEATRSDHVPSIADMTVIDGSVSG